MSLTVTQRPFSTTAGDFGDDIENKWNAVVHPLLYKMQRKDFEFDQINDNSGSVQLQFNSADLTSSFSEGDQLYIQSDNSVYAIAAVVVSSSFSTNTLVNLDIDYTSSATTGYANNSTLRPLYNVEVYVYDGDDVLINESPFYFSPNPSGLVAIDISSIVKASMIPDVSFDLTSTTEVEEDSNAYKQFYVKYTETWIGSSESQTDDSANKFYAVLGALQIPSTYGSNLQEYTPTIQAIEDSDFTSNWVNTLTGDAWTFGASDMSVSLTGPTTFSQAGRRTGIDILEGYGIYVELDYTIADVTTPTGNFLDLYTSITDTFRLLENVSNSSGTASVSIDSSTTALPYIMLRAYTDTGDMTVTITEVRIMIVNARGKFLTKLNTLPVWDGWPFLLSSIFTENNEHDFFVRLSDSSGDYDTTPADTPGQLSAINISEMISQLATTETELTVQVFGDTDVSISELKSIEVRGLCKNPVMLMGRNSLGGILVWVFDAVQEYTFDYGNDAKNKRLVLYAEDLNINEWEALQDFITLGAVYRNNITEFTSNTIKTHSRIGQQLYVIDKAGNKTGVVAIPTSQTTKTNKNSHSFEIEIEFPETFLV